ncbi:MAG TPA: hypothetical protein VKY54_06055 [Kiloniellales bacterium]|jgi:hypothetical protein|nr:hypothetical protein [Kiloniellales bacterium]
MSRKPEEGVFALLPDGRSDLVHAWMGEDYELADIAELFGYGRWEQDVLVLTAQEVAKLRIQADAESFDHEEGLIRLCLDLQRFQKAQGLDPLRVIERG